MGCQNKQYEQNVLDTSISNTKRYFLNTWKSEWDYFGYNVVQQLSWEQSTEHSKTAFDRKHFYVDGLARERAFKFHSTKCDLALENFVRSKCDHFHWSYDGRWLLRSIFICHSFFNPIHCAKWMCVFYRSRVTIYFKVFMWLLSSFQSFNVRWNR